MWNHFYKKNETKNKKKTNQNKIQNKKNQKTKQTKKKTLIKVRYRFEEVGRKIQCFGSMCVIFISIYCIF